MAEASPPNLEEASDGLRAVALGGMKRVFKSRQKARERALQLVKKRSDDDGDESDDDGESESDRDAVQSSPRKSRVQKTSHHYTLNMPSPSAPHADTPYILLGSVGSLKPECLTVRVLTPESIITQISSIFLQPVTHPRVPLSGSAVHSYRSAGCGAADLRVFNGSAFDRIVDRSINTSADH